jgi:hypothetical protein
MTQRKGRSMMSLVVIVGALAGLYAVEAPSVRPTEAQSIAAFESRVKEYLALHKKLESTLPKLPKRPTQEQVDKNQRALGELIKSARPDAKPGEFFTPGMQALVKRVFGEVLSGPDGKTVKASIMDENPGVPKIVINQRYPSSSPLSTMPTQVLAPLPKLPEELEYRFIGSSLILMDAQAAIILDYTDDVLSQ